MPLRFQDDFLKKLEYLHVVSKRAFVGQSRAEGVTEAARAGVVGVGDRERGGRGRRGRHDTHGRRHRNRETRGHADPEQEQVGVAVACAMLDRRRGWHDGRRCVAGREVTLPGHFDSGIHWVTLKVYSASLPAPLSAVGNSGVLNPVPAAVK